MGPSTTPPWRLIESPTEGGAAADAAERVTATGADRPGGPDPALLRTAAMIAAAAVLAIIAFILAFTSGSGDGVVIANDGVVIASNEPGAPASSAVGAGPIVVDVTGAVAHPGVIRLPAGSRIADLIDAAGGYGPRVDTGRVSRDLNLAAPLRDGDQIHVPSRDEPTGTSSADDRGGGSDSGPLDLNQATAGELDGLPGIGPVTAEKILAAREESAFASVDDLRTRGVLGEKTFERIRDLVAVP